MCGISVVISENRQIVEKSLDTMVRSQIHRGPDAHMQLIYKANDKTFVGMGHNRLSIIDLSTNGNQPMESWDNRFSVVLNGEIYNYIELANELKLYQKNQSRSMSDTRVFIEAFAEWGLDTFKKLRGMWAAVIFDKQTGQIILSRDRFGIKPLYLFYDTSCLYIASEIKAIILAHGRKLNINRNAAVRYITYGLLNTDQETFFKGIRAFEPASFSVIDLNCNYKTYTTKFWSLPSNSNTSNSAYAAEELQQKLVESVSLHLRSDVPIGFLLSGGLDSSAILGFSKNFLSSSQQVAFSVVSNEKSLDESYYIDEMAQFAKIKSLKYNVSNNPEHLLNTITEASWANDQPLCALSDVSHLMLMRQAKNKKIKVLLSGQGSDEQFGGYNKFFYFFIFELIRNMRLLMAAKITFLSLIRSNILSEFKLGEAIRYMGSARLPAAGLIHPINTEMRNEQIGLGKSYADREQRDLFSLSLPALLHYEDRMSMWNSVEVRLPFLDHYLVEFALSLPAQAKFGCGRSKSILRKSLRGVIPDSIRLRRDKKGFGIPESQWASTLFRPTFEKMLRNEMRSSSLKILTQDGVRLAYKNFLQGKAIPNGRQMMRVLLLERFLERFSEHIIEA